MKKRMKKNSGFTLIEILVAAALVAILFAAIGGVLMAARHLVEAWEARDKAERMEARILKPLEKDLFFEVREAGMEALEFRGSEEQLDFTKMGTGDRVHVVYRFLPGGNRLERGEQARLSKEDRMDFIPLGPKIKTVRFSFFGKEGWVREWKAAQWPMAVQVKGIFLAPSGKEVSFERQFYPIQN